MRPLYEIAKEISKEWKTVNFAAKPYLQAMADMDSIESQYGCDDGKSIILYFLANASGFRGERAKSIKNELKSMIK